MSRPVLYIDAWMRQARMVHHPVMRSIQVWPEGQPPRLDDPVLPVCSTQLPADFCSCGAYMLLEDDDA